MGDVSQNEEQNAAAAEASNANESGEANAVKDEGGAKASEAKDDPVQEVKPPDDKAEIARLRDQLLRTAADFDNYRKRTRREMDDAQRRGKETAVKDLLPVFDDLERAAAHAETTEDAKSLSEGIRMVLKKFQNTLERMGIKRVPALGVPFDPAMHEAIQQLPSTEYPAGTVMAEVQPGYSLGDYLVRAAMVVVSKGPPPN